MKRPGLDRGFSLTGGLVVGCMIAIFVFLAVMLIDGSKTATQTVGCMSNLRKLHIGMMMFADDHGGYWIGSGKDGVTMHTTMIWSGEKRCWLGVLYHNYVTDLKTFYCPAQKDKVRPACAHIERFGKTGEKCCSDYDTIFYSGRTVLLDKLKDKIMIRCGEQDLVPSPHGDRDIILGGNGSIKIRKR